MSAQIIPFPPIKHRSRNELSGPQMLCCALVANFVVWGAVAMTLWRLFF